MSDISNHDYSHAKKVWKRFDMKNLEEYHDLYLKTDVLLQSNVFEAFRSVCLKQYSLDPTHFYTSPGLAWQACLKQTGIELELLTNPNMLEMFERRIRGGITQAVHRYVKADNKYMDDQFSSKEVISVLLYLDANNLYGWAMSQLLPTGGFNWVDPSQFTPDNIGTNTNRENECCLLRLLFT